MIARREGKCRGIFIRFRAGIMWQTVCLSLLHRGCFFRVYPPDVKDCPRAIQFWNVSAALEH